MKEITSYKVAIAELEQIIRQMQSPECDIDLLSDYTKRALTLLKFCKEKLMKTDEEVKRTLETLS